MKKTIRIALLSAAVTIGLSSVAFAQDTKPAAATPATTTPAVTTPAVTTPAVTTTTVTTPVAPAAAVETSAFTPVQINQMHEIIRNYLVSNPQVLVEASQALQAQQEKQMQTSAMSAIEQNKTALFNDASSPTVGSKTAPVILVEFFDYQCGHCRSMAPSLEKLVTEDKNLHVIFKELPIFGGVSDFAAKAALAVATMQPEKYYAYHNALLTSTGTLTKESVIALAKKEGLNVEKLKKDMELPAIQKQLHDNFLLAQSLKVMGTPTFVVANQAQTKFAYIPGATSLADLQTRIKSVQ